DLHVLLRGIRLVDDPHQLIGEPETSSPTRRLRQPEAAPPLLTCPTFLKTKMAVTEPKGISPSLPQQLIPNRGGTLRRQTTEDCLLVWRREVDGLLGAHPGEREIEFFHGLCIYRCERKAAPARADGVAANNRRLDGLRRRPRRARVNARNRRDL